MIRPSVSRSGLQNNCILFCSGEVKLFSETRPRWPNVKVPDPWSAELQHMWEWKKKAAVKRSSWHWLPVWLPHRSPLPLSVGEAGQCQGAVFYELVSTELTTFPQALHRRTWLRPCSCCSQTAGSVHCTSEHIHTCIYAHSDTDRKLDSDPDFPSEITQLDLKYESSGSWSASFSQHVIKYRQDSLIHSAYFGAFDCSQGGNLFGPVTRPKPRHLSKEVASCEVHATADMRLKCVYQRRPTCIISLRGKGGYKDTSQTRRWEPHLLWDAHFSDISEVMCCLCDFLLLYFLPVYFLLLFTTDSDVRVTTEVWYAGFKFNV